MSEAAFPFHITHGNGILALGCEERATQGKQQKSISTSRRLRRFAQAIQTRSLFKRLRALGLVRVHKVPSPTRPVFPIVLIILLLLVLDPIPG
jgi:hypothetical protein